MVNQAHARQLGIVQTLRSRESVSATALADRFGVGIRTIYRDVETLTAHGIPIQATTGRHGGYRLAPDNPIDPLTLDSDHALRLYVLGLTDTDGADLEARARQAGISGTTQEIMRRLTRCIHFDTADWYWRDEGSGHLPALRYAMLTGIAVEAALHSAEGVPEVRLLKPYAAVWKAGEWHMVAAASAGTAVDRFRLNLVDRLTLTDLRFTPPEDFDVRTWWTAAMEDFGKGPTRVELHVAPSARDELLRLSLKSTSQLHDQPDGSLLIVLFVDRWHWLVPLVTSYGPDVVVTEPAELRDAVAGHLRAALAAYEPIPAPGADGAPDGFRTDDSRLRSTRGRTPRKP
ncbi:helix-turn-helix transcriptional regulator [Streptacidiphilus jiangxiensis]|uniref:Predicted DNA-binding transcriptional regulator YafY, contains an HTH and WYL domains n=1 Tax=Streptacidiphilus jiangxiensis TaxID=235985 RepID=A0A1H8BH10_STRJI|nr:WYL domain-containing protein [Streptacidiphilus jiangxiensis]SEM81414.1 Predicted DNA-binding transcriptional regulator YafY, contains an HTH and WYL domains [Streptacidiphilus jiangxiensis]